MQEARNLTLLTVASTFLFLAFRLETHRVRIHTQQVSRCASCCPSLRVGNATLAALCDSRSLAVIPSFDFAPFDAPTADCGGSDVIVATNWTRRLNRHLERHHLPTTQTFPRLPTQRTVRVEAASICVDFCPDDTVSDRRGACTSL